MGHFCQKQSATRGARASCRDAAYTDTGLLSGEDFYYTSQSLSTVWSSVSECQQQHVFVSLCPFASITAGLGLQGTCIRKWTPPSSSGPISHSQSKCKCPAGRAEGKQPLINKNHKNQKSIHKSSFLFKCQRKLNVVKMYLFKLVSDRLGLLVPLEPHHVLGVKPPWLFL